MADSVEDPTKDLSKTLQSTSLSTLPDGLPSSFPSADSLPRTLIRSFSINSINTDMWIQVFQDKIVFGVSQLHGRIGNFLLCEPLQSPLDLKQIHYEVTNLLGAREQTLLNVYAKQLCERIIHARPKGEALMTIVLGISLDKHKGQDPDMFKTILDLLVTLYQDVMRL